MSSVVKIRELPTPETKLMSEVFDLSIQTYIGKSATSASLERSFSTAQRLKTWFRATNDTRVIYQLDKHTRSIVDLANKFSNRNDYRKRNLVIFKESAIQ